MPQHKIFIVKLVAVDRFATGAVVVGEVASLAHEPRNDTVERRAFVAEARLASAELSKVLGSLWHLQKDTGKDTIQS